MPNFRTGKKAGADHSKANHNFNGFILPTIQKYNNFSNFKYNYLFQPYYLLNNHFSCLNQIHSTEHD